MKSLRSFLCYLTAFGIILASLTDEVEARRTILRGRKVINRSYLRDNAIPAWSIVVLVGFCQIVLGGVLYIVLRKIIISNSDSYTVAPTDPADDDDDDVTGKDDANGSTTGKNTTGNNGQDDVTGKTDDTNTQMSDDDKPQQTK